MNILQRRAVRVAAAAVAVIGCVALPTGANASLLTDTFWLESSFYDEGALPYDYSTVGEGYEFMANDGTYVGDKWWSFGTETAAYIDVQDSAIEFFFDYAHEATYSFWNMNWVNAVDATILAVYAEVTSGSLAWLPTLTFGDHWVTVYFNCVDTSCDENGTVLVTITPEHNVIPLPAALPIYLSVLAGLGFFGWRRRQVSA